MQWANLGTPLQTLGYPGHHPDRIARCSYCKKMEKGYSGHTARYSYCQELHQAKKKQSDHTAALQEKKS